MPYRSPHDFDEGDLMTGTRVCRECDVRQPMERFHFANGKRHRRRICKSCVQQRVRVRRTAEPERYARLDRDRAIRAKYGMTADDFDQMLEDQDHRCAVCDVRLRKSTTHVDHDHETNRVRGLLCFNCNVAIGHFRDDPRVMERAAWHVRRARERWTHPKAEKSFVSQSEDVA